jgi:hypothetical protein
MGVLGHSRSTEYNTDDSKYFQFQQLKLSIKLVKIVQYIATYKAVATRIKHAQLPN